MSDDGKQQFTNKFGVVEKTFTISNEFIHVYALEAQNSHRIVVKIQDQVRLLDDDWGIYGWNFLTEPRTAPFTRYIMLEPQGLSR